MCLDPRGPRVGLDGEASVRLFLYTYTCAFIEGFACMSQEGSTWGPRPVGGQRELQDLSAWWGNPDSLKRLTLPLHHVLLSA